MNMRNENKRCLPGREGRSGFTLLEVIAVLAILGLLVGLALADFDTDVYDATTEADELKRALRYAQSLAFTQAYLGTNDEVTWGLQVNTGSYTLIRGDDTSQTDINLPGINSPTYNLPSGVSATAGTVFFNFRGQPSDSGGAALTSDTAFTVSSYSKSKLVTVTQETGFMP